VSGNYPRGCPAPPSGFGTGGEPLLRPGLVGIVAAVAALRPRPEISLTTNGIGLDRMAPALVAAGLNRVNVSLDTVEPR
jgi:GTP 3',8-cyclase